MKKTIFKGKIVYIDNGNLKEKVFNDKAKFDQVQKDLEDNGFNIQSITSDSYQVDIEDEVLNKKYNDKNIIFDLLPDSLKEYIESEYNNSKKEKGLLDKIKDSDLYDSAKGLTKKVKDNLSDLNLNLEKNQDVYSDSDISKGEHLSGDELIRYYQNKIEKEKEQRKQIELRKIELKNDKERLENLLEGLDKTLEACKDIQERLNKIERELKEL